jgi:hypothetical protein
MSQPAQTTTAATTRISESDAGYWADCMRAGLAHEAAGKTIHLHKENDLHDAITRLYVKHKKGIFTITIAGNVNPVTQPVDQFLLLLVQWIQSAVKADFVQVVRRQGFRSTLSHYRLVHPPHEFRMPHQTCLSTEWKQRGG